MLQNPEITIQDAKQNTPKTNSSSEDFYKDYLLEILKKEKQSLIDEARIAEEERTRLINEKINRVDPSD